MNKAAFLAAVLLVTTGHVANEAHAASVSKSYRYFSISGTTIEEIEADLARRGPKVKATNARHPGATQIEFKTRVTYGERNGRCGVHDVNVTAKAEVILPRWRRSARADADTRLIWDVLAADIKRHEEYHVTIARNYARELENTLKEIRNKAGCDRAQETVKAATATILERHDRAQERFDRVESINFEDRLQRLIRYRAEQMPARR